MNLASLNIQVCTSNSNKKLQIALWALVAVECLRATKLLISPYPVAQLRQFFFIKKLKIVLSFRTQNLSVPQT